MLLSATRLADGRCQDGEVAATDIPRTITDGAVLLCFGAILAAATLQDDVDADQPALVLRGGQTRQFVPLGC